MIRPIEMFRVTRILWQDLIESGYGLSRFPTIEEMHHRVEHNLAIGGKLEWTQEEEDQLFAEGRRLYDPNYLDGKYGWD